MMEQAVPLDGVNAWKSASSWMSVDEEDSGSNVDDGIVDEEEAEDEGDNDIELIVQAGLIDLVLIQNIDNGNKITLLRKMWCFTLQYVQWDLITGQVHHRGGEAPGEKFSLLCRYLRQHL